MGEIEKNEYKGNTRTLGRLASLDASNPLGLKGCYRKPTTLIRHQIHGLILYLTALIPLRIIQLSNEIIHRVIKRKSSGTRNSIS